MKLAPILMLATLVGALVVLPMFLKGPNGQPIMQPKDLVPEPVQKVSQAIEQSRTVYRWKDADGVWQFSDTRPEGVADADLKTQTIASIMTLPSTAFTGDQSAQATAAKRGGGPNAIMIPLPGTASSSAGVDGVQGELPVSSQPAMQQALDEIATRFPQFKAMSDAMAQVPSE
ncbi:MAG: DUF4124 domain-containing protein [Pseudomonadales bacterium]|nr:DUF4124 domain-containing protein [Pseudomonadales bacterium]